MSDAICRKCGEPWEVHYLRHEGLWDYPGEHAPGDVITAHVELITEDEGRFIEAGSINYPKVEHPTDNPLYCAVLSGGGCPSCWHDPSRIPSDPKAQGDITEASLLALFDCTDDDPAMFL